MMTDKQWRIAIHEAAHACIARAVGLPGCGEVSVVADNPYARFPNNQGSGSLATLMAGAAAEVELLGDYDEVGVTVDEERVRERLLDWYGSDAASGMLWDYALDLVKHHRAAIERLAHELVREQVLDGDEVDAIFYEG